MGDNQLRQSLVACFIVYPKGGQRWGGHWEPRSPLYSLIILQVNFQFFHTGGLPQGPLDPWPPEKGCHQNI